MSFLFLKISWSRHDKIAQRPTKIIEVSHPNMY